MYKVPLRPLVLSLLASTSLCGQAVAQDPSGSVIKVNPAVNATGPGGERLLELEGAVFQGDQIVASPNGLAEIRFVDDTQMIIGPNSRLTVDEFVYNPANSQIDKLTVSAVKGVFRFISGNSPHEAYAIRTPTMTIGVRGTTIHINARGAESSAVFTAGSGTLCDAGGACIPVTDDCSLHIAPSGGGFSEATGFDRRQRLSVFFPFLTAREVTACASSGDPRINGVVPETSTNKGNPGPAYGGGGGSSGSL